MTDTVFCKACGEPILADSRFCEHCGSEQDAPAASGTSWADAGAPALERVETFAPGSTQLASQLLTQLRTPAVATALIAGALAAAATFGIGLILSLILSDQSMLGVVDQGRGIVGAGFAQMLNFVQAGYGEGVGKLGPALFVIFPIGACAIAAATQARRTLGLPALTRLLAGAGVGVVFGFLMLIPALGAGSLYGGVSTVDPNVLEAVVLGALWGVIGGLLGTWYIVRTGLQPGFVGGLAPVPVREAARTVYVALRPLALMLALMTVAGTVTWTIETLLKPSLRQGLSTPVATIDHAAYAFEHGLHWTELGGMAQFRLLGDGESFGALPVPVGDISKIKVDSGGHYRVFGLSHAMPAYTFVPLLIFLLGAALLLALSAGFALASSRAPATPLVAAAWGCLVGPIWALALVILNALIAKDFFGRANGDSVFGTFLLGGLVAGALGGLLSTQSQRRQEPSVAGGGAGAP